MANWQRGEELYENDDYASMMECAKLFSTALAHNLYGEGILAGEDFMNTLFRALWSSLSKPPDGQTFAPTARRAARLVLTLMRENGLQPKSMGGQGVFDDFVMDKGNFLLLSMAVAPNPDKPWEGRLEPFFAVPPQPAVKQIPNPDAEKTFRTIDQMYDTSQKAKHGDPASEAHMNGTALWANGQPEEALAALSEAAKLGSVDAMKDAGDLTTEMGRLDEAKFWFESAANAGHPGAMWNMALYAFEGNDRETAAVWHQRAAEAGYVESFAALTQLARDRDDEPAQRHWAQLGAEAGQTFCMVVHGTNLMMAANGDLPTLRRARDYLEEAAHRGAMDAALMAVSANGQLGDEARAQRFVKLIVDSGDLEKIDRLRRYGLL